MIIKDRNMYTNLNLLVSDFSPKISLMKILEYVNKLICIYEYLIKRQCQTFHLAPNLLIYVHHSLRYAKFPFFIWICRPEIQF